MTRSEIVRKAREYLGTPFHHQGRVKGRGVDCAGLVVCVLWEMGFEIDDCRTYPQTPDCSLLEQKLRSHLEEIPIDRAGIGDVYLMTVMGYPQHIALITDKGVIHTHRQAGKVVETVLDHAWKRRIVAAFRVPGLRENDPPSPGQGEGRDGGRNIGPGLELRPSPSPLPAREGINDPPSPRAGGREIREADHE